MKKFLLSLAILGLIGMASAPISQAQTIEQYASSVIGFSSEWSSGQWSAAQSLGAPNTFGYGDIHTSWAPLPKNGSLEYLTLGFAAPVHANGLIIRETYGNGFVYQVDALDLGNNLHTVWSGVDTSLPNTPWDFAVSFPQTAYQVAGVKIYVDTNHNFNAWEEIDSVRLIGNPVPEPGTIALLSSGIIGLFGTRRKKQN